MVLGYLISPVVQIVDSHGKPIVGAKIYVYKAGTTNTVNTYRDFSNHYNPTPVLTNTLGNCTIIAPDDMIYDIVVKDNRNNLLMSKDNLTVSSGINPDINLRFNQGYGIIIRKNGNTVTISIDTDVIATKDDLAAKQDKLTAGDNIDITNNNIINVVNRKTLYTQWPLKVDRGSSMVKLYLDQDFVGNTTEILPGADLTASYDEFGHKIIGVDTNSSATGNYNFYAGYDNAISGNYSTVFGRGNTVSGNSNTVIGDYATLGDYYFAVGNGVDTDNRSNALEVRKNGDIYYKYDNNMTRLAPYTGGTGIHTNNNQIILNNKANYRVEISKEYTINSDNEYVVLPLSDEFAPVKAWLNANYTKMTCPLFYTIKIEFDSQVQNPGMALLQLGYSVSWDSDPVISRDSPYAYITKFWSQFSDAHATGWIDAKNMTSSAGVCLDLRNIESNTKWTAGQKLKVTIGFYTRYIS